MVFLAYLTGLPPDELGEICVGNVLLVMQALFDSWPVDDVWS